MLNSLVLFAALGLALGVIYAGLGVGLVTTYRGTGVVNLAQGAYAMWGAYVYQQLRTDGRLYLPIVWLPRSIKFGNSVPTPLAFAGGVASAILVALLSYALVFRPLRNAPQLASIVATIGITTILQSIATIDFGTQAQVVPSFYLSGTFRLGGQQVPLSQIEALVIALCVTTAIWSYLRFARAGLATMAVSESPRSISLFGYSPGHLAVGAWALSGALAGLAGILAAPIVQLSATNFTLFIVPALAAVLIARFRSVPGVFVAGVLIGVGQSELGFLKGESWFPLWLQPGIQDALPFLVIVVALLLSGRRIAGRDTLSTGRLPAVRRPKRPLTPVAVVIVVTGVGLATLDGTYRFGLIQSVIAALLMLSFVLLTGYAGQISVAQVALAGAAGLAMTRLSVSAHVPFPFAALLGVLAAVLLGMVVALPALRVRGIQLVVATLALAVATQSFIFGNPVFDPTDLPLIAPPKVLGLDLSVRSGTDIARIPFALLCLVLLLIGIVVVANIMRGTTGLRLLAVRSNERVAASIGIGVTGMKLMAFAVAAALAGLAGALTVYSQTQFSSVAFDTLSVGLPLLAFAYLGGITSISGALVAALLAPGGLFYVVLNALFAQAGLYYLLVTGLALVVTAISYPDGIVGTLADRIGPLLRRHRAAGPLAPDDWVQPSSVPDDAPSGPDSIADLVERSHTPSHGISELVVRDLTVRYGGVRAVSAASLNVRRGEIVGLIGPNGAGKTSLIDAISGFAKYTGTVLVDGEPITDWPAHRISRRGVARTWQNPDLFADITVEENLAVADAPDRALRHLVSDVLRPRAPRDDLARRLLASFGLNKHSGYATTQLSLGQQKVVGVARALANNPGILLLDEPAAGLDTGESEQLGHQLRLVAKQGIGMLLVDHDMDLIFGVCDRVVVLVFGEVIAEGSPSEIRANTAVVEAYLGAPASSEPQPADRAPARDPVTALSTRAAGPDRLREEHR